MSAGENIHQWLFQLEIREIACRAFVRANSSQLLSFHLAPHPCPPVPAPAIFGIEPSPLAGSLAPARGGLSGWQRRKLVEFIEAHIGDALPLMLLAGLVNLSQFHFARAFKRSFGSPPHRYHTARRIARAKILLADPARPVTEIARMLGFAKTSSFSTAFRKATSVTPSRYRRGL